MYSRRGILLTLVVLSLALMLAVSGPAEAGPHGPAEATAPATVGGKLWGWVEAWLAVARKPLAAFAESDCDQGSHIDPNGGPCILGDPSDPGNSSNSDHGSHIDPDG